MKEVELHPSQIVKERGTSTRLGCLSRCDGSAVLMSELGSCCVGIIGPVEAKEKDQDPIKMICQVTLHPPSGKFCWTVLPCRPVRYSLTKWSISYPES